jgi:hypothetical protein
MISFTTVSKMALELYFPIGYQVSLHWHSYQLVPRSRKHGDFFSSCILPCMASNPFLLTFRKCWHIPLVRFLLSVFQALIFSYSPDFAWKKVEYCTTFTVWTGMKTHMLKQNIQIHSVFMWAKNKTLKMNILGADRANMIDTCPYTQGWFWKG